MPYQPLILVIEDDERIRRFIVAGLSSQSYRVIEADRAESGLSLAGSHAPDVILLDLGLPDRDGVDLIRALRAWTQIPIIVVSARGHERSKVVALDAGADDYLTKPFGVAELLARVRVALRHVATKGSPLPESGEFRVGELVVNLVERTVLVGGEPVHLTRTEYRIMTILVRHAGKVVTHQHLLTEVWGPGRSAETQYVRVFMATLRRKLEPDPARPRYLLTEVGVGYRLLDE
ncbi:MAG: response regulator [Spirochaetaceae bacterium]|nr:MAG: response regulator [Spirochaetaceae bacterium]